MPWNDTARPSGGKDGARPDGDDLAAAWFRRHPGRAHRVRRFVDGELPGAVFPAGLAVYVIEKRVAPGCLLNMALWASRQPCGCEGCAAELWRRLATPRVREMEIEAAAAAMPRAGR
jgi:hypothetical protein